MLQPNYPNIIFLQSTLINIVVVFLIFVSIFAWKEDRRLNSLVVPIVLNQAPNSRPVGSPQEIPTVQLEMERREAGGSNLKPQSKSYHVTRRSEDPYTFHKVVEPENGNDDNVDNVSLFSLTLISLLRLNILSISMEYRYCI